MQKQIRHRQHKRQRLKLHPPNRLLQSFQILHLIDTLRSQMINRTGQKTTRPTGRIKHLLTQLRIHHLRHKLCQRTRRIKFPISPRRLKLLQNRLVNIPK